jgi:hypothetical protein
MNSLSRLTLGTLSSVFLTIGMVSVASQLDPVTRAIGKRRFDAGDSSARSCSPCPTP